jgi:hypothetical protein
MTPEIQIFIDGKYASAGEAERLMALLGGQGYAGFLMKITKGEDVKTWRHWTAQYLTALHGR